MVVSLNNESFISESIFPFGDEAPYIVETGFRFPAPIGDFKITITYSGCDLKEGKETSISYSSFISVFENMVTPLLFNGEALAIGESENNNIVTLEDIYKKLETIEEKQQITSP
jgi:hypothetical protein